MHADAKLQNNKNKKVKSFPWKKIGTGSKLLQSDRALLWSKGSSQDLSKIQADQGMATKAGSEKASMAPENGRVPTAASRPCPPPRFIHASGS